MDRSSTSNRKAASRPRSTLLHQQAQDQPGDLLAAQIEIGVEILGRRLKTYLRLPDFHLSILCDHPVASAPPLNVQSLSNARIASEPRARRVGDDEDRGVAFLEQEFQPNLERQCAPGQLSGH